MTVRNFTRGRDVLTTGEIARMCEMSPRVVSGWIDSGILQGWRIPGGSKDRRVDSAVLAAFFESHGMIDARKNLEGWMSEDVAAASPPVQRSRPAATEDRYVSLARDRIYFIRSTSKGLIKIGSSNNPDLRLIRLRQENRDDSLTCLGVTRGGPRQEFALHDRFAAHRVEGEWFRSAPDLLAYIAVHCVPIEDSPLLDETLTIAVKG